MKYLKLFEKFTGSEHGVTPPNTRTTERLISFTKSAFQQYNDWKNLDKSMQDKISVLIEDCFRDPFRGLGKPEALKRKSQKEFGALPQTRWSRRINGEHRLIYEVSDAGIKILSCKGHYDDH